MAARTKEIPLYNVVFGSTASGNPVRGRDTDRHGWNFADGANKHGTWEITVPATFSTDPRIQFLWRNTGSATSGTARWSAQIGAVTPNTDTGDYESKTLTTQETVDDAHLGTTAGRLHMAEIDLASTDSMAAGDKLILYLGREGSHANDTLSDTAMLVGLNFSFDDGT